MEITIRKGYKGDVPAVFSLVKELAVYEKAPDEVTVTVEDMERDGFGDNPLFKFIVAETQGRIVGMALYYIKYSSWKGKCVFLDDIVVTEKMRRFGIGKKMFEAVITETQYLKAGRLEWQVLDWNTPAIKFYEKYKSQVLKEWVTCRLTKDQMAVMEFPHVNREVSQ